MTHNLCGAGTVLTAVFEAWINDTRRIDSHNIPMDCSSLAAHGDSEAFEPFTIGDTNLVGGFNRLKVRMCFGNTSTCGPTMVVNK